MELFLKLIKLYGAALIGYGFIFFVVLRIYKTTNYKRKALASAITGTILILITIVGLVIDANRENSIVPKFSFIEPYYVFLIASVLMSLIISVIYLVLGITRHQRFAYFSSKINQNKVKVTPTIKDKKEFVYVVFSCDNDILLKKDNDYYTSYIAKLNNKILFHDEMINQIIEAFSINTGDTFTTYKQIGKVTVEGKIDKHYYCYNIKVDELNPHFSEYTKVSAYDLVNYNLDELDKQILYHYILKDYFDIKIKEN